MTPHTHLLFTAWHNLLDPSNGASISTREVLLGLANRGWQVASLCGPGTDFPERPDFVKLLESYDVNIDRTVSNTGTAPFSLLQFQDRGIVSTIHLPDKHLPVPDLETGNAFLQTVYDTMKAFKPDVLITYGGFWTGKIVLDLAKRQGVKTVVLLHNLAYSKSDFFENVDLVIVPSNFAANHYRATLGLEPMVIPSLISRETVCCKPDQVDRQYVVFVNPEPMKGVSVFIRIAKELSVTRPDIPFLVVEARHKAVHLKRIEEDLRNVKNLHVMGNTSNPKSFYRVAKIVLQPSLCNETFGRVAAEAMMNGIPVIGSNRGALPETIGSGGVVLPIPDRYTPDTIDVPTVEEVQPWIDAITNLWDNDSLRKANGYKGLHESERWKTETLLDRYEQILPPHNH